MLKDECTLIPWDIHGPTVPLVQARVADIGLSTFDRDQFRFHYIIKISLLDGCLAVYNNIRIPLYPLFPKLIMPYGSKVRAYA